MNKFLALDFETGGLNPIYDGILQVGAAVMDETGMVHDQFTCRITPSAKLYMKLEAIEAQSGEITPASIAKGYKTITTNTLSSIEAFIAFRDWVNAGEYGKLPVVAWNASFDHGFWGNWIKQNNFRANGSVLSPTWICAMMEARNHPLGLRNYGLDIVAACVGAGERPKAHDALVDAVLAGTVYGRLLRGIYSAEQVTA